MEGRRDSVILTKVWHLVCVVSVKNNQIVFTKAVYLMGNLIRLEVKIRKKSA